MPKHNRKKCLPQSPPARKHEGTAALQCWSATSPCWECPPVPRPLYLSSSALRGSLGRWPGPVASPPSCRASVGTISTFMTQATQQISNQIKSNNQNKINLYCSSGWNGQVLAKRIWSGSKQVFTNHLAWFLAECSWPATSLPPSDLVVFFHRRPGSY